MKTPQSTNHSRITDHASRITHRASRLCLFLTLSFILYPLSFLFATLSEPDNLVYGLVYLDTNQVTAANTNVLVEARRLPGGPAIATCRMGDNAAAGNYYSLAIPLEALAPLNDAAAAQTGDTLFLVVVDTAATRCTNTFTVGTRGQVTRLDLGTGNLDTDQNGLTDDWERRYFGAVGQNPNADPDLDGQGNLQEFQAGTDPLTADVRHPADLNPTNNCITIHELTAYALAWKTGLAWPVGPTNIDVTYVTRAGYLWRNGEEYRVDLAEATNAPLWWVNGHQIRSWSEGVASGDLALQRSLPAALPSNQTVQVLLTVTPTNAVFCYAVEEQVPPGWDVSTISEGGFFDAAQRKIRWGLFFDQQVRELVYHTMPRAVFDEAVFDGLASFDGVKVPATGRRVLVKPGYIRLKGLALSAGQLHLLFQAESGRTYQIETSADLRQWKPKSLLSADDDGRGELTEPLSWGAGARFFRARLP